MTEMRYNRPIFVKLDYNARHGRGAWERHGQRDREADKFNACDERVLFYEGSNSELTEYRNLVANGKQLDSYQRGRASWLFQTEAA